MKRRNALLKSCAMVPVILVAGAAVSGAPIVDQWAVKPAYAACNPCAAACNPCAAACNPCAAACNPCAAACNPCAAACNPCAAACNPCAAACNPCASACNPCAAACNPCAAACNPCAAACNPCNPCGACNPCAASGSDEPLTTAEAAAVYASLLPKMVKAYSKSGNSVAAEFASYRIYSTRPYTSATHGGRQVMNYANDKARAYGAFENAGTFPQGAILAKPSFAVKGNGSTQLGPLFVMEKMAAGFNSDSDDWRYTMIMPNGSIFGTTNGENSNKVGFCVECHQSVTPDQDHVMLLPEEYRVK